jgi:hypothetical protein
VKGLAIVETPAGFVVRCGCNGMELLPAGLSVAVRAAQCHMAIPAHEALRRDHAGAPRAAAADQFPLGRFGRACSTTEVADAHASVADAIGEVAAGPFLDVLKRELGYLPSAVIDAVVPALRIAREVRASHRAIAERCGR